MQKRIFRFYILCFFLTACGDKEEDPGVTLPSNLQISVNLDNDGSGEVSVTATADNANFYQVYFDETSTAGMIKVSDGKATYTYTASGTYTIKVQAHATADAFITATKDVLVTLSTDVTIPSTGYTTPLTYSGMELMWQDEFEGETLNTSNWTFETGGHGWGNNELQFYRPENTSVKDGYLVITAKQENYQGKNYTSSRIITKDKQSLRYGRVDIRAALPKGQGIWPALWMLGSNFSSVGWPACGEIDIMEMIGGSGREKTIHGTIHWDNAGTHANYGDDYTLATGTFSDKFHVFSIVWTASSITWYVDDVQYNVADITPAGLSEFHNNFFFIFNVAVGGNWPGSPDASTAFPQQMIVDYIRVFQPE